MKDQRTIDASTKTYTSDTARRSTQETSRYINCHSADSRYRAKTETPTHYPSTISFTGSCSSFTAPVPAAVSQTRAEQQSSRTRLLQERKDLLAAFRARW